MLKIDEAMFFLYKLSIFKCTGCTTKHDSKGTTESLIDRFKTLFYIYICIYIYTQGESKKDE